MESGDLVEIDDQMWFVSRARGKTAWLSNGTVTSLPVPLDSLARVVCNPLRDWTYVPVRKLRGDVTEVRRPTATVVQNLVRMHAWVPAGVGVYINPAIGLRIGDTILVLTAAGHTFQTRIKTLDTLGRRVSRRQEAPAKPFNVFDHLMQNDDD